MRLMSTLDVGEGASGAVTCMTFRPDTSTQNVALLGQVCSAAMPAC
jgi:hypothetical protein